jgi:hypothetical protein
MRKIIWGLVIVIVVGFIGILVLVKNTDKKLANSDNPAPAQTQPVQTRPATSTPPTQATSTALSLPVKYNNTQYGFIFSLPADWQGYSVYTKQWTGNPLPMSDSNAKQAIYGTEVVIRNPNWTQADRYEDIPIMIFTADQWSEIQQDNLEVSAAPFPPSELGRNQKYVFALPPRYNYDFSTGFEEVEKIMQSNPLQGY